MKPMSDANLDLVSAFPAELRDDALKVVSALPKPPHTAHSFSVEIGEDTVMISYRIYHDPAQIDSSSLSRTQCELLGCLLTRHHSGFVRAENLTKILGTNHEWVPPFILQLVGEYVVEIICSIRDGLDRLNPLRCRIRAIQDDSSVSWHAFHRSRNGNGGAPHHASGILNDGSDASGRYAHRLRFRRSRRQISDGAHRSIHARGTRAAWQQ